MADVDDETAPLLHSTGVQVSPEVTVNSHSGESVHGEEPPPYSSYDEKSAQPPPYYVRPTTPTPSEGTSAVGMIPHINCRVCQVVLSVEGKLHLHVIKCHSCGEATPIRPAPSGKKYVRCPCNCLLICKATSQRIICPRPNCKRVISLGPPVPSNNFDRPSDRRMLNPTRRIICAHCNTSFLWVQPGDTYDKCPHCDRFSSFGPSYRSKGMRVSGVFGAIMFLMAVALTGALVYCEKDCNWSPWSFIAFGLLYAVAFILFLRVVRFACIKVSRIERSNLQYT